MRHTKGEFFWDDCRYLEKYVLTDLLMFYKLKFNILIFGRKVNYLYNPIIMKCIKERSIKK